MSLNLRTSIGLCEDSSAMERLILFDIDGTLTRTQNGYIPVNLGI